ncbi:hypothetical protein CDD83_4188 [Cordyceps sp. RAO-2017]|nr:hypothetical protein CDD83_4188 [Cordyceps sp. RAO-2017]
MREEGRSSSTHGYTTWPPSCSLPQAIGSRGRIPVTLDLGRALSLISSPFTDRMVDARLLLPVSRRALSLVPPGRLEHGQDGGMARPRNPRLGRRSARPPHDGPGRRDRSVRLCLPPRRPQTYVRKPAQQAATANCVS